MVMMTVDTPVIDKVQDEIKILARIIIEHDESLKVQEENYLQHIRRLEKLEELQGIIRSPKSKKSMSTIKTQIGDDDHTDDESNLRRSLSSQGRKLTIASPSSPSGSQMMNKLEKIAYSRQSIRKRTRIEDDSEEDIKIRKLDDLQKKRITQLEKDLCELRDTYEKVNGKLKDIEATSEEKENASKDAQMNENTGNSIMSQRVDQLKDDISHLREVLEETRKEKKASRSISPEKSHRKSEINQISEKISHLEVNVTNMTDLIQNHLMLEAAVNKTASIAGEGSKLSSFDSARVRRSVEAVKDLVEDFTITKGTQLKKIDDKLSSLEIDYKDNLSQTQKAIDLATNSMNISTHLDKEIQDRLSVLKKEVKIVLENQLDAEKKFEKIETKSEISESVKNLESFDAQMQKRQERIFNDMSQDIQNIRMQQELLDAQQTQLSQTIEQCKTLEPRIQMMHEEQKFYIDAHSKQLGYQLDRIQKDMVDLHSVKRQVVQENIVTSRCEKDIKQMSEQLSNVQLDMLRLKEEKKKEEDEIIESLQNHRVQEHDRFHNIEPPYTITRPHLADDIRGSHDTRLPSPPPLQLRENGSKPQDTRLSSPPPPPLTISRDPKPLNRDSGSSNNPLPAYSTLHYETYQSSPLQFGAHPNEELLFQGRSSTPEGRSFLTIPSLAPEPKISESSVSPKKSSTVPTGSSTFSNTPKEPLLYQNIIQQERDSSIMIRHVPPFTEPKTKPSGFNDNQVHTEYGCEVSGEEFGASPLSDGVIPDPSRISRFGVEVGSPYHVDNRRNNLQCGGATSSTFEPKGPYRARPLIPQVDVRVPQSDSRTQSSTDLYVQRSSNIIQSSPSPGPNDNNLYNLHNDLSSFTNHAQRSSPSNVPPSHGSNVIMYRTNPPMYQPIHRDRSESPAPQNNPVTGPYHPLRRDRSASPVPQDNPSYGHRNFTHIESYSTDPIRASSRDGSRADINRSPTYPADPGNPSQDGSRLEYSRSPSPQYFNPSTAERQNALLHFNTHGISNNSIAHSRPSAVQEGFSVGGHSTGISDNLIPAPRSSLQDGFSTATHPHATHARPISRRERSRENTPSHSKSVPARPLEIPIRSLRERSGDRTSQNDRYVINGRERSVETLLPRQRTLSSNSHGETYIQRRSQSTSRLSSGEMDNLRIATHTGENRDAQVQRQGHVTLQSTTPHPIVRHADLRLQQSPPHHNSNHSFVPAHNTRTSELTGNNPTHKIHPSPFTDFNNVLSRSLRIEGTRLIWTITPPFLKEKQILSEKFPIANACGHLKFFPQGSKMCTQSDTCSLYLQLDTPEFATVQFRLFVQKTVSEIFECNWQPNKPKDKGRHDFCQFSNFVENNVPLEVGLEVLQFIRGTP